jgi:putative copper export protein
MQAALGLIHGADFLAAYLFLGLLIFVQGVAPAGGAPAVALLERHQRWLRALASLTFLTSLLWMLFSSADMADGWQLTGLWQAMTATRFGHLWCVRVGALLALSLGWPKIAQYGRLLIVLLLGLPLISSVTGHAAAGEGAIFLPVATDVLHSLAVATWAGGLWGLSMWLGRRLATMENPSTLSLEVVTRFSHFAMTSTGLIAGTGLYMAYRAGVDPTHPWATRYGTLILLKVLLFASALMAASINQFVHMRRAGSMGERRFAQALRREVRLELALAVLVFFLAGYLARTELPVM